MYFAVIRVCLWLIEMPAEILRANPALRMTGLVFYLCASIIKMLFCSYPYPSVVNKNIGRDPSVAALALLGRTAPSGWQRCYLCVSTKKAISLLSVSVCG